MENAELMLQQLQARREELARGKSACKHAELAPTDPTNPSGHHEIHIDEEGEEDRDEPLTEEAMPAAPLAASANIDTANDADDEAKSHADSNSSNSSEEDSSSSSSEEDSSSSSEEKEENEEDKDTNSRRSERRREMLAPEEEGDSGILSKKEAKTKNEVLYDVGCVFVSGKHVSAGGDRARAYKLTLFWPGFAARAAA